MSYIYLSSPYSHQSDSVRQRRYELALHVASRITEQNITVYSPIVHNRHIALKTQLPSTFDYWSHHNYNMLRWADKLWILTIDGWLDSVGIKGEVEWFDGHGMRPARMIQAINLDLQFLESVDLRAYYTIENCRTHL